MDMTLFRLKRTLKMGLKSLSLRKLRSALTLLGITFGVCSVIAMLAIGEGASQEAQEQIKQLGSHNIIVQSVKPPQDNQSSGGSFVLSYGLKYKDAERIRSTVPNVKVLVQARKVARRVKHAKWRVNTKVVGTVPWYPEVSKTDLKRGRFFNTLDMNERRSVCALGSKAAEELFPLGGALGSLISVENRRYRVIGILGSTPRAETNQENLKGNPNRNVYIPFTTMKVHYGETIFNASSGSLSAERVELHELIVQVDELERVQGTANVIRQILTTSHEKDDYQVIVPLQLLRQSRETRRIFSIVLGSIAALSLLVGGIGVMNITLASVVERTREIGIRRAMGAKKAHIVTQFLTETTLLCMFGGGLGIGLGLAAPYAVSRFTEMATEVTLWSVALAFGISVLTGLIFGIYPAYRAANMDPIVALRHE